MRIIDYAQTVCRHQMTALSHFIFDRFSLQSWEQIFFLTQKLEFINMAGIPFLQPLRTGCLISIFKLNFNTLLSLNTDCIL